VLKVDSAPPGAHIFIGTRSSYQPGQYLGTTPCNASVPAEAGGKIWGEITFWAVPPTNTPGLHAQSTTFGNYVTRSTLPPALFFDLTAPPR